MGNRKFIGMLLAIFLMAVFQAVGCSSAAPQEPGVGSTEQALCPVPALSGTVGALPAGLPNQTPPGYITAIVANGTPTLQVTYQTTGLVTTTLPVVSGDPQITFTGGWQKNGVLFSVVASGNTITFNNGQGHITVANATVSGSAVWSGTNSGVGKITGSGISLQFAGYNANSSNQSVPVFFTVCKNPPVITTTCTTNANCTGGTAPACGNVASGICSAGICDYSLNWTGTTNCQCLEGDIQSCIPAGHSVYDGNQTCAVTSTSPLITNWGTCQTGYGGHTPVTEFNATSRNCSGTSDCQDFSDYPVCADYDKLSCEGIGNAHPWACKYRLAVESGCSCIQYDIRNCTKSGGGAGHQTCVITGTDPTNDWGEATGWNTCS